MASHMVLTDLNSIFIFYTSMRGVYVLDLENDHYFVICGSDLREVSREWELLSQQMKLTANYDGSFHFYPIQPNETEYEAEKRIYWMLVKKQGLPSVYARKELLQSIGKGTWTMDMEIKRWIHTESMPSCQDSSTEKEIFQISI